MAALDSLVRVEETIEFCKKPRRDQVKPMDRLMALYEAYVQFHEMVSAERRLTESETLGDMAQDSVRLRILQSRLVGVDQKTKCRCSRGISPALVPQRRSRIWICWLQSILQSLAYVGGLSKLALMMLPYSANS